MGTQHEHWYDKRTADDYPGDVYGDNSPWAWAEGYNAAVRAYTAELDEALRAEQI